MLLKQEREREEDRKEKKPKDGRRNAINESRRRKEHSRTQ